jgi:hypothetical protein
MNAEQPPSPAQVQRLVGRREMSGVMITEDLLSLPCTWNGKADSCPMCSGECCNYCGAGCWSNEHNCQHDSLTRHAEPPNSTMDSAGRTRIDSEGPMNQEAKP